MSAQVIIPSSIAGIYLAVGSNFVPVEDKSDSNTLQLVAIPYTKDALTPQIATKTTSNKMSKKVTKSIGINTFDIAGKVTGKYRLEKQEFFWQYLHSIHANNYLTPDPVKQDSKQFSALDEVMAGMEHWGKIKDATESNSQMDTTGKHPELVCPGISKVAGPRNELGDFELFGRIILPKALCSAFRAVGRRAQMLVESQIYLSSPGPGMSIISSQVASQAEESPPGLLSAGFDDKQVTPEIIMDGLQGLQGVHIKQGLDTVAVVIMLNPYDLPESVIHIVTDYITFVAGVIGESATHGKSAHCQALKTVIPLVGIAPRLVGKMIIKCPYLFQAALIILTGGQLIPSDIGKLCFRMVVANELFVLHNLRVAIECVGVTGLQTSLRRALQLPDLVSHDDSSENFVKVLSKAKCSSFGLNALLNAQRTLQSELPHLQIGLDETLRALRISNPATAPLDIVYAVHKSPAVMQWPVLPENQILLDHEDTAQIIELIGQSKTTKTIIPTSWSAPTVNISDLQELMSDSSNFDSEGICLWTGYLQPVVTIPMSKWRWTFTANLKLDTTENIRVLSEEDFQAVKTKFSEFNPQLANEKFGSLSQLYVGLLALGLVPRTKLRISKKALGNLVRRVEDTPTRDGDWDISCASPKRDEDWDMSGVSPKRDGDRDMSGVSCKRDEDRDISGVSCKRVKYDISLDVFDQF